MCLNHAWSLNFLQFMTTKGEPNWETEKPLRVPQILENALQQVSPFSMTSMTGSMRTLSKSMKIRFAVWAKLNPIQPSPRLVASLRCRSGVHHCRCCRPGRNPRRCLRRSANGVESRQGRTASRAVGRTARSIAAENEKPWSIPTSVGGPSESLSISHSWLDFVSGTIEVAETFSDGCFGTPKNPQ
jgi:hypothetical protein